MLIFGSVGKLAYSQTSEQLWPLDTFVHLDKSMIEKAANTLVSSKSTKIKNSLKQKQKTSARFLKRLAKRERRLIAKLKTGDSIMLQKYNKIVGLPFDSLQVTRYQGNIKEYSSKLLFDSLSMISSFISSDASMAYIPGTNTSLASLQKLWSEEEFIKGSLLQRANGIGQLLSGTKYEKQVARITRMTAAYKGQIAYWEALMRKPDAMEQKLLDYLGGVEGFDDAMGGGRAGAGYDGMTEEQARALGYQTRKVTEESLNNLIGNNSDDFRREIAQSVREYINGLAKVTMSNPKLRPINKTVQSVAAYKQSADEMSSSVRQLQKQMVEASGIRNPMLGVPFRYRWKYDFNYQVNKAVKEDGRPVMLQIGINASYQQNPNLALGVGVDGCGGLGQSWTRVKLTYEGLVGRAFINYRIILGIHLEAGYEKYLRPFNREYSSLSMQYGGQGSVKSALGLLHDAAYVGLQKRYRINSRLQGSILIGYNFLNDKLMNNSPWIIRMGFKL